MMPPGAPDAALEERFEHIQYGARRRWEPVSNSCAGKLLPAADLGTLLAAISLPGSPVVLTLISGGVFENPLDLIWKSITWAFDETQRQASETLDVIVNGRNLYDGADPEAVRADVRSRGEAVLHFDKAGLTRIDR
jgi:hypothetical protein